MQVQELSDVDLTNDPRKRGQDMLNDLDHIRDYKPVFWSEKSRCWLVTRHADVVDAFQRRIPVTNDGRMFPVFHLIPPEEWEARIPTLVKYSDLWITSTEGERHARLRSLMMKALNRKIVEALRPYAQARAEYLVDTMIAAGELEFNEGISRAMTGDVLFQLLGMPPEMVPNLRDWATWLMEGVGATVPTPARLEKANLALEKMNEAVALELDKRRKEPKEDFLTGLLHASEGEDRLSYDEILAQMHVAIVAGHDTTMNTLTLSVDALARDPEAWAYLEANQDKMLAIVTELQRHIAMVGGQPRLVYENFELHGEHIRKGDMLAVMIATANRDPALFENPDRIDFTRDNRHSMTFAPGIHFCLGHHLAKMQLTEFLGALVRKVKRIEVLDDALDFLPVWVFRGVYQLNVRVTPR
ncbi:cytochrome P450 [Sandaracinobacter sp. RS1-74]|uniref:cytochrome P450 n=1 Tax=Sandaracinobacteroides sayramensis TaxID=2913411 RepID=UPI001EDA7A0F|nr:cytochrome P450 [Sandaracinobacteroides sayramensis]MCG2840927.1 cytochrome P450 [Sandaracinobacteroides sayramensis]